MTPSRIVAIDAMPLTPSGKLNRRALPPVDTAIDRTAAVEPRTPQEATLVEIWKTLLGLERVGVHDNFFALNGDSIKSIQLVSRANEAGLVFKAQDVFRHQTIASLAQVARERERPPQMPDAAAHGEIPLTPMQRWFLDRPHREPHHFNMSRRFQLTPGADLEALRRVIGALMQHHDMLRGRYRLHQGRWRQHVETTESHDVFSVVDLAGLSPRERSSVAERRAQEAQRSLNLADGPVVRALVFDHGRDGADLLLVIHHLVVDGVSWRVLTEDLIAGYRQAVVGDPIVFVPKTRVVPGCAWRLAAASAGPFPAGPLRSFRHDLPIDFPAGEAINTSARSSVVSAMLSAPETDALLHQVPAAYHAGVDVLLISALGTHVVGVTGDTTVAVDVEGHGRDERFGDLDVSRTVGWFTKVRTLDVDLDDASSNQDILRQVKEALRIAPPDGALREPDPSPAALAPRSRSTTSGGSTGSPATRRSPARRMVRSVIRRACHTCVLMCLEVNCFVTQGVLNSSFVYCNAMHRETTVARLATIFMKELRSLLMHCLGSKTAGLTPSDFPLACLTQGDLDSVLSAVDGEPCRTCFRSHLCSTACCSTRCTNRTASICTPSSSRSRSKACSTSRGCTAPPKRWFAVTTRYASLLSSRRRVSPIQVLHRDPRAPWRSEDLRNLDGPAQERALRFVLEDERRQRFALARAPLLRWMVVRLADTRSLLTLTSHHALGDGWSGSVLFEELMRLYEGDGIERTLPPAPPYSAYVAWLARQDADAAAAYWRGYLSNFEGMTPLAPEPVAPTRERQALPADMTLTLSESDTVAVEGLARSLNVTPSTIMQAVWALLLSRLTGDLDVAFGITVANRPPEIPRIERAVGLYVSTVPVRVMLRPDEPLSALAARLQRDQADQLPHRHLGLTDIKKAAGLNHGRELFDTLLVFDNYPGDQNTWSREYGGIRVVGLDGRDSTHYPLTLVVGPGRQWTLRFIYQSDRFETGQIREYGDRLVHLILQVALAPSTPSGLLSVLTEAERAVVVTDWNATATALPPATTADLFEAQVARTPDAVALESETETLTYAALDARAAALAAHLRAHGVGPEAFVGLALDRSVALVVAVLATFKAGAAYLPLDPAYPPARLAQLLADARPAVVLTTTPHRASLPAPLAAPVLILETLGPPPPATGRPPIAGAPRGPRTIRPISSIPPAPPAPRRASSSRSAGSSIRSRGCAAPIRSPPPMPCSRRRRSGSTSRPGSSPGRSPAAPASSSRGPTATATRPICGACSPPPASPSSTSCPRSSRSFSTRPPAHRPHASAWSSPAAKRCRLRSCRAWPPSSAPPVTISTARPRPPFTSPPGPAPRRPPPSRSAAPFPMPGSMSSMPQLAPVRPGVAGELYIGGLVLARGYHRQPALTATRFVADPYSPVPGARMYATGDRARWRPDGVLDFLGRRDQQIKLRGVRIELGEIEAVLAAHPAVAQAVVVPRDTGTGTLHLVAYVVPARDAALDLEDLRRTAGDHLPSQMVPSSFMVLDALPRTSSGKLDRRSLPTPERTGTSFRAPQTPDAIALCQIFEEVLSVERVGTEDDFFALGGHSLLATRVVNRARTALGVELPIRTLFEHPTVSLLCEEAGRIRQCELEDLTL